MTRVAAFVPDLMDRSKVAAAGAVTFVAEPSALLTAAADVVVIDLTRPGAVEVVAGLTCRVVAFANHERTDLLDAARSAGAEVYPRSVFFRRLPELLA